MALWMVCVCVCVSGWNTTGDSTAVASAGRKGATLCVVLRAAFPTPPSPSTAHADYHWWQVPRFFIT